MSKKEEMKPIKVRSSLHLKLKVFSASEGKTLEDYVHDILVKVISEKEKKDE